MVTERVPRETGSRAEVLVEAALRGAAIAYTRGPDYAGQETVRGEQEWVLVGDARDIEDGAAEQQIMGKLQRIPAQAQIQSEVRQHFVVIFEESSEVSGPEVTLRVTRSRLQAINRSGEEMFESIRSGKSN